MDTIEIDYRERKGREIADGGGVLRRGDKFRVQSQTKAKTKYWVELTPTNVTCTCPDHKKTGQRCKHICAAEIFVRREQGLDGSDPPVGPPRPTYPRNYQHITAAQAREEDEIEPMMFALCQSVADFPYLGGRPRSPLCDVIFAILLKVYLGRSARRAVSRLKRALADGYLSRMIPYGTLLYYMERPEITPILEELIVRSSLPLVPIETVFAIDSTGMSGSRFVRWTDIKYRGVVEKGWAKLHVMIGTRTMIVTAAFIGDRDASDTVQLPRLLEITARNFTVRELSADKAYNSKENQQIIADLGARAFIAWKSSHRGKGGGAWTEQYQWWKNNPEEFDKHYHQRSKVESAFMSMKTVFGDSLRSRTETAMRNEALAKLICHNMACLNRAMDQFGIGAAFLTATLEAAE